MPPGRQVGSREQGAAVASKQTEIADDQKQFDRAWDERERKRANLKMAPGAAGGPNKGVGQIRKAAEKELDRLGGPDDAVAFGRFDQDGECMFIGNHMISTDDRDLLVINWQAKGAEPFYRATIHDPLGVQRKRTYQTLRNTILDFDEVVFAQLADQLEELTGPEQWGVDDAVLKDLEADRTGEMRDIVQTIHAAQYELIRTPIDRLLLVQGGPGTGKTAVALHRISWLLYNHQDSLRPEECLVIGPNPTFTRYIKAVLPGLGDSDVAYRDLRGLGPQTSHGLEEGVDVSRIKGELRMADLLREALWQRVRFPERAESLEVGGGVGAPTFTREEIERELRTHTRRSTYSAGRMALRAYLSREAQQRSGRGPTPSATTIDNALERVWPSLTPQAFVRDLLSSRDRLLAAAGEDFTAADVTRLQRSAAEKLSEERWSDADVALLDEADELINGRPTTYAHIVVDEAQDLSPMQLRSVRRRSRSGSMTVVGDLAQSTGAWARDSWEEVAQELAGEVATETAELTLGYRVPRQVFEFAAQLLPFAAPEVTAPRVVRSGPADPELVEVPTADLAAQAVTAASAHAGSGRFVGLICPEQFRSAIEEEFSRRDISWGNVGEGELDKAINLARPAESKGLEFDAVVVVDPTGIVSEAERGYRMLYVALTRTTKYLTVVHDGVAMPGPGQETLSPELRERAVVHTVDEPPAEGVDISSTLAESPGLPLVSAKPAPHPAPSTGGTHQPPTHDLATMIVRAASMSVADQIKASVAPAQWAQLIDQLRRDLDVSQDDVFELFD